MFTRGTTMVILRSAGLDDYGDPLDEPTRETVSNVALGPSESDRERAASPNQTISRATAYVPGHVELASRDAVELFGDRWEVEGEPSFSPSPFTGWAPGTVIELKRVTG